VKSRVARKESAIDSIAREGSELESILKGLGIHMYKRVSSKNDEVKKSQARRKLIGKTAGVTEEDMSTLEYDIPLKLVMANTMPDPTEMTTISSKAVWNLAKRKIVKKGAASRSTPSDSVDEGNKKRKVSSPAKYVQFLRGVQLGFQDGEREVSQKEKEASRMELEWEKQAAELKITAFNEGNFEVEESKEEVEVGDGADVVAKKVDEDQSKAVNQEVESLHLRVKDFEGLLEVEKNSSAELQVRLFR
ncbi:hypothetical protein GIB67_040266, partial [Kingdonia uniflora]